MIASTNLRAFFTKRKADLFLGAAFLVVCAGLDLAKLPRIDIDSHSYMNLAQGLLERHEYLTSDEAGGFVRSFVRTPIYSALIAALLYISPTSAVTVIVWMQRLLWAWLIACFLPPCAIAAEQTSRRIGCIGKAVALLLPVPLLTTSMVLSETIYTVISVVAVQLLCVGNGLAKCTAAGVLFGVATLIRPVGLWVPVIVVGAITLYPLSRTRDRFIQLVMALVISLAIPGAWMLHVHQFTGRIALTTLTGPTFALNRQAVIENLSEHQVEMLPSEQQKFVSYVKKHHDVYWATVLVRRDLQLSEAEASDIADGVARYALRANVTDWAVTTGRNLAQTFGSATEGLQLAATISQRPDLGSVNWAAATRNRDWLAFTVHAFTRIFQPMLLLGFPIYLLMRYRREAMRQPALIALLLISTYLVIAPALLTISYGRFVFPVLPVIAWIYLLPGMREQSYTRTHV